MYEYAAQVIAIHDGDTVTLDVDLGLRTWNRGGKYRLFGINAPEFATPSGVDARQHLQELVGILPARLTVQTHKDATEKYGRWLATLIRPDGVDINASMLTDGFAVEYLP